MIAVPPGRRQVVPAEREPSVGEQLVGPGVGHGRPLELEEDELALDRGGPLLHPLHQRADGRGRGVDREPQTRVGPHAPHDVLEVGELVHERREALRVELGHLAAALGEALGERVGPVEERVDRIGVAAVEEWGEVPGDVDRLEVGFGHSHRLLNSFAATATSSVIEPASTTLRTSAAISPGYGSWYTPRPIASPAAPPAIASPISSSSSSRSAR